MNCTTCGHEVRGNFCTHCGREMRTGDAPQPADHARYSSQPPSDPLATAVLRPAAVAAAGDAAASHAAPSPAKEDAAPARPEHHVPLPPLTRGQLFHGSANLYKQNFLLFAGTTALVALGQGLIAFALYLAGAPSPIGNGLILLYIPLASGLLAPVVTARYLGRPITIGQGFASIGLTTFGALLVASILYTLSVLVLLIIPGIYLLVRFLFVPQAIVLERTSIRRAFGRSSELVKGSWWRVFGLFILTNLPAIPGIMVGVIVHFIVAAVFGKTASELTVLTVANFIVPLLILPIPITALTMLYYDLRYRKEGFSLEHAA